MKKPTNGNKSISNKMYRKELSSKKEELLTSLGFNFKKLSDTARNSDDDLIVALQDEFLHSGLDRVLHGQLQDVEAALERIKAGEFGDCAGCGAPISAKRLQAIPWANYCVECQDRAFAGQPHQATTAGQEIANT